MNKWHRLTNIDEKTRTGYCSGCKTTVRIEFRNRTSTGKINWRCSFNQNRRKLEQRYRLHKKLQCEKCGFVAEHPCQLDVDHVDGNHNNDNPSNLVTLCANCHRLKTWQTKVQPLP